MAKGKQRKGRLLRRIKWLAVLAVIGAAGWAAHELWYEKQDRETQERVQLVLVDGLDLLREWKETPEGLRYWLDLIADQIPASFGRTVDLGEFDGETIYAFAGLPEAANYPRGDLVPLKRKGYIVGYDERLNNPAWVAFSLEAYKGETAERPDFFSTDRETRSRIEHNAYTNSGYDRGHMAPNYGIATSYGRDAQMETFLMSNIVPQKPDLNRGLWRELEWRVATRHTRRFGRVWVTVGPVYDNLRSPRRLESGVAIPDAFFAIVVDETDEGAARALAFLVPQTAAGEHAEPYLVSIDEIEQRTGFDFLKDLPDPAETQLEANTPKRVW